MAKLRKWVAYRQLDRPNTRKSKYRKKSFVRGAPVCKIVKFNIGNLSGTFAYRADLICKRDIQIRDNALESARLVLVRLLEKNLGKVGFRFQMILYPHHVVREHALAAGAGADRFSSGMAHSFGKPTANAAQIRNGQKIMSVFVNKQHIPLARKALQKAVHKLPCSCTIDVVQLPVKPQ